MNNTRAWLRMILGQLKHGQSLDVEGRIFRDAYKPDYQWGGIYLSSEQAFMSSMVGAAWGAWRVDYKAPDDIYTVSRHPEGKTRVYVDPDREHLFDRMPDGSLVRNQRPFP